MQVSRHFSPTQGPACALAIGNFDGLHRGHLSLLTQLVQTAKDQGLKSVIMTFEPHPKEFFDPLKAPNRLSSVREKLERFAEMGIDVVYLCQFNAKFASISSKTFLEEILIKRLNVRCVLVGEDFRFGANRDGGIQDIEQAGLQVLTLPSVMLETDKKEKRVSSTAVREALAKGDLVLANLLLGRPYSMSGKVVTGARLGRQLGFPTANVHMRHERPALKGVYAVKLDGRPGVANLGYRPTLGVPKLVLEVHLFNFDGDLYNHHVHVEFFEKIRDEMKFSDLDALREQIAKDANLARQYFNINT
jgi:riboflavin kinase / FMN adenylyltransferase